MHFHCVQRLGVGILRACAARGIPHVLTIHDAWWISPDQFLINSQGASRTYDFDDRHRVQARLTGPELLRKKKLESTLRVVDRVLTVSGRFADVCRKAGLKGIEVVENGLPRLPKPRPRRTPSDKLVIGYAGGFDLHKGYQVFREAVLSEYFLNMSFIVVNHGLSAGRLYEERWGENEVTVIGKVAMSDVSDLYASIDILIAPSIWPEAYGLVTREALYFGCWILASDQGDVASPVREGANGFKFSPNPDNLATLLRRLNHDWRDFKNAPSLTETIRNSREQAEELLAIYRCLLAPKGVCGE